MEKHYIIIDNCTYMYRIKYKHIKSIYIRIEKGEIVVSAPKYTSKKTIEELLIQYKERFVDKLNHYQEYIEYKDKGNILIFDHWYTIKVLDINERKCIIHGDELYVYHHDLIKTIDDYLKQLLLNYIHERVIYYLSYHFDLDLPDIVVREYKGRWGSCFYKENKISFNISLIHLDKDLIDYVIVHELCHFIQANHSKEFYKEIEKRLPDYKLRMKRLKEEHV